MAASRTTKNFWLNKKKSLSDFFNLKNIPVKYLNVILVHPVCYLIVMYIKKSSLNYLFKTFFTSWKPQIYLH